MILLVLFLIFIIPIFTAFSVAIVELKYGDLSNHIYALIFTARNVLMYSVAFFLGVPAASIHLTSLGVIIGLGSALLVLVSSYSIAYSLRRGHRKRGTQE